jgi:hypothetical protein
MVDSRKELIYNPRLFFEILVLVQALVQLNSLLWPPHPSLVSGCLVDERSRDLQLFKQGHSCDNRKTKTAMSKLSAYRCKSKQPDANTQVSAAFKKTKARPNSIRKLTMQLEKESLFSHQLVHVRVLLGRKPLTKLLKKFFRLDGVS